MGEVKSLLASVSAASRSTLISRLRYDRLLASKFNTFDFIDPKENRLSSILAFLLNPKAAHGQGSAFLLAFITFLRLPWKPDWVVDAEVVTEHRTPAGRRIDVFIVNKTARAAIAIENKLWAVDQNQQLNDYISYIRRYNVNNLIYITAKAERQPSEKSINADDLILYTNDRTFLNTSWAALCGWLTDCRSHCRAPRVQNFLDDFELHILKTYAGVHDLTELEDVENEIFRGTAELESALKITNAWPIIRDRLLDSFHERLQNALFSAGMTMSGKIEPRAWRDVDIDSPEAPGWSFAIGFDHPGYESFYYGIKSAAGFTHTAEAKERLHRHLSETLAAGEDNKFDNVWAWWRHPTNSDPLIRVEDDWGATPDAWLKIRSGELVAELLAAAKKAFDAVKVHSTQ